MNNKNSRDIPSPTILKMFIAFLICQANRKLPAANKKIEDSNILRIERVRLKLKE